ncbi:MAG: bifunctional homocysteine S-methyltransferase/5,10-methylenetetrahydrofolate reductase protein [Firmicutes bacterium ADurb.Bin300]|nr:MAG: bifunctional homocysteine S-methyltransferase/5,10-methylenetetrahydrofolate reductase protein [Firmicutes bacterium ADurb.Bin300]
MREHIENKMYHIEILPPKQETENLQEELKLFAEKYNKVLNGGYCACITDNAMGYLAFQGTEIIEHLKLPVFTNQVMIHLNTFHTKADLHNILDSCKSLGIKYLLVVSGDGSERLPKLQPADVNAKGITRSVTAVELLKYIESEYPNDFCLGVAFNPYEPAEHEYEKLDRKLKAGAKFIVTQPIIQKNDVVDKLIDYCSIPVFIEAWMSKKISLLSQAVGYEIPENEQFDPIETLKMLHKIYSQCGAYLSILGFKTQYALIKDIW